MIRLDDFRMDYLEEARECMRASNSILKRHPEDWYTIPEFWANLFGAAANGNIAAVSDDVAWGILAREDQRRDDAKKIRDSILDKLGTK